MAKSNNKRGLGLVGTLTVIFIVLKLCKLIAWSWWWVLSPIWITVSVLIGIIGLIGIFVAVFKK